MGSMKKYFRVAKLQKLQNIATLETHASIGFEAQSCKVAKFLYVQKMQIYIII